jgi:hypothetical protein
MQYDEQTQQQMFAMIASWKQSGLSQKQYCEQNNIRYYVFHYWYKRYRDQQPVKKGSPFVALDVKASASFDTGSAAIELLLGDGKRILFHSAVSSDYLKALIS